MAITFYNQGEEQLRAGTLDTLLPDLLVHFERSVFYDGGFGFDWLRDEYIYETKKETYDIYTDKPKIEPISPLCWGDNVEKLKASYERMNYNSTLVESEKKEYYVPYLSMFPNHEQKTGNKVEIVLNIDVLNKKWKQVDVEFICPEGIRVEPDAMQITKKEIEKFQRGHKEKPKEKEKGPKVEIICDKELENDCKIEVKVIGESGICVGQLIVAKNKEIPLNIRLVQLVRKQYRAADEQYFADRMQDIVSYLEKKSLQQALIVPKITTHSIEIDDTDRSIVDINKSGAPYLVDDADEIIKETYRRQYDEKDDFKGVIVFLYSILSEGGEAGSGIYNPTQSDTCQIFKIGLEPSAPYQKYYSSVAHEIAHVLGLDHTFERRLDIPNEKDKKTAHERYEKYKKDLPVQQKDFADSSLDEEKRWNDEAANYNRKGDSENAEKCRNNAAIIKSNREIAEKQINYYQKYIESYESLNANFHILFPIGRTDNIMDYHKNQSEHAFFSSFFRWQWSIMQNEIKRFHS